MSRQTIVDAIVTERQRQVEVEGFDRNHDAHHYRGVLAKGAAAYAKMAFDPWPRCPSWWPWEHKWWKPNLTTRRKLIVAAALILAELEKLELESNEAI